MQKKNFDGVRKSVKNDSDKDRNGRNLTDTTLLRKVKGCIIMVLTLK